MYIQCALYISLLARIMHLESYIQSSNINSLGLSFKARSNNLLLILCILELFCYERLE